MNDTPGAGFVNVGNINQVYAKSGFFPILQNDINGSSQLSSSAAATSNSRSQGPTTATATTGTNGCVSFVFVLIYRERPTNVGVL